MTQPDISIIVAAFNMARELPRTLLSLSREYQCSVDHLEWEVLVVDNGSAVPLDSTALSRVLSGVRVTRIEDAFPSPGIAINDAVNRTSGRLVGVWIDGARIASPGILARAHEAWTVDASKVIGTLGFHLGPDVQMQSVPSGYDQTTEDALLDEVQWPRDAYRLFEVSVVAGSSKPGWFGSLPETNAMFADRDFWSELGGIDPRFCSPGGGYANHDLWERAVANSNGVPWMVLGEATFHQVHGGAATSASVEVRTAMRGEYAAIHGG